MSEQERNAARERIATACLAAMLNGRDEWAPGMDGHDLAEVACNYADSLLGALERRQPFASSATRHPADATQAQG